MKTRHKLSTIFSFLFDPRIPLLFIVGVIVMAVAGNAAYSLILKFIRVETVVTYLMILMGSILVLVIIVIAIKIVLTKFFGQASVGKSEAFKVQRRGIIYTMGMQTDTIRFSLESQKPVYVGFLCSKASEPFVNELIKTLSFGEDKYNKKIIDPQDIIEIRVETNLIIDWMFANGLKGSDIVVDVTGGMTTMSVAAFSIADELKIDSQYIKSDFDDKNRPIKNTQRGVFVKRYAHIE